MSIIIFLLILSVLVMAHELGHFFVAKRFGIRVLEFWIGMGPKLFSFKKGETEYSFRLLPIGGACMFDGEDGKSKEARIIYSKRDEFGSRRPIDVIKANRPIIILDEPTVGLDPLQRIEVRELIRGLGGEHTVLLSSHILSEISEVADVVLILSHGRLVAQDTPENLAKHAAGSNRCTVTVKGEKSAVLAAVEALPLTVAAVTEKEEGLLELVLESESDIREALFYALADARCPILEESAAAVSLEDIFLELTGEEETARAAEAEAAATVRAAREKQTTETAEAVEISFEGKEEE